MLRRFRRETRVAKTLLLITRISPLLCDCGRCGPRTALADRPQGEPRRHGQALMVAGYVILFLGMVQVIAAVAVAAYTAFHRRWFAAGGVILGFAIGILPFFVLQGSRAIEAAIPIAFLSFIALPILYAIARRWKALLVILMLLVPVAYLIFGSQKFPPSSNAFFNTLAVLGELSIMLGPILCALAGREVLSWVDRITQLRRSM
jgi:hypothetical protein